MLSERSQTKSKTLSQNQGDLKPLKIRSWQHIWQQFVKFEEAVEWQRKRSTRAPRRGPRQSAWTTSARSPPQAPFLCHRMPPGSRSGSPGHLVSVGRRFRHGRRNGCSCSSTAQVYGGLIIRRERGCVTPSPIECDTSCAGSGCRIVGKGRTARGCYGSDPATRRVRTDDIAARARCASTSCQS
jgi:hypothetical protein